MVPVPIGISTHSRSTATRTASCPTHFRASFDGSPEKLVYFLNQSFLGFTNLYRQFVLAFAEVALPITNLLKTEGGKPQPSQPLAWSLDCQHTFKKLKRLFAEEPVLKHPDPKQPFVVQVDTSVLAVAAVLLKVNAKGQLQALYFSKAHRH